MTNKENRCPLIKINHRYYPDHTCVAKQSYCNWPLDYQSCDVLKRHNQIVEPIIEAMKKELGENND